MERKSRVGKLWPAESSIVLFLFYYELIGLDYLFSKGISYVRKIGIRNPRIKQIRYTSFTIEEKDTNAHNESWNPWIYSRNRSS